MTVNLGVSELPGRTFGKMQVMTDVQAAYNLLAAQHELREKYGEVITFNEGDRSRADQDVVWFEYLNGGPLAATRYTSTHDPVNNGNAADLGGPGGTVISDNARELLDGNHPRGVVGRKYGVFNTGWNFWKREVWHFNVYPGQAEVLAPAPSTSTAKPDTKPAPKEAEPVKVMKFGSYWGAIIGARICKIDALRVNGKTYDGKTVRDLLQRVEKSTPAAPAEFNDVQFNIIRAALKRFK